jgi:ribosomal protein L11 methyltransferase
MNYVHLQLKIEPLNPFRELLTYYLAEAGFETFEEKSDGLEAYCQENLYEDEQVQQAIAEAQLLGAVIQSIKTMIPWKNWNEEWEKQFAPEIISDRIYIRALFHEPRPEFPIEIIIHPKMAFGTGHHSTTALMMQQMLKMDFNGKTVIDMGCGTGILGILGLKLGAKSVFAIDIDPVAVENTMENARTNHVASIRAQAGKSDLLQGKHCDVLLANINRNIIIEDLPLYYFCMNSGAHLLTSGYYAQDLPMIRKRAESLQLEYISHEVKEEWCCAVFKKITDQNKI